MNVSHQLRLLHSEGSISLAVSISETLLRHNSNALGLIHATGGSQTSAAVHSTRLPLPLLVHAHYLRSTFDWVVSQLLKQGSKQGPVVQHPRDDPLAWNLLTALLVGSDHGLHSALASIPSTILISIASACSHGVKLPQKQGTALLQSLDRCLCCLLQLPPFNEKKRAVPSTSSFRPSMDQSIGLLASLLEIISVSRPSLDFMKPLHSLLSLTLEALVPIVKGHPSPKKVFQAIVPRLYLAVAAFGFPSDPNEAGDADDLRKRLLEFMELVVMNESHVKGLSESASAFAASAGFFEIKTKPIDQAPMDSHQEGDVEGEKKSKRKRKKSVNDKVEPGATGEGEGEGDDSKSSWTLFQGALLKIIDESGSLPALKSLPWLLSCFCKAATKYRKQVAFQESLAASIHRKKRAKVAEDGSSVVAGSNEEKDKDRSLPRSSEFELALALISIVLKAKREDPAPLSKVILCLAPLLQSLKDTGAYHPTIDPSQLIALRVLSDRLFAIHRDNNSQDAPSRQLLVALTDALCSLLDVDHRVIQSHLESVWSLIWKAAEGEGGVAAAVAASQRLVSAYKELRQLDFLVESMFDHLLSSGSPEAALAASNPSFSQHLAEAIGQVYSGQSMAFVQLAEKKISVLAASDASGAVLLACSGLLASGLLSIKVDLMTATPLAAAASSLVNALLPHMSQLVSSLTTADAKPASSKAQQQKGKKSIESSRVASGCEVNWGLRVNWALLTALARIDLAATALHHHCGLVHPSLPAIDSLPPSPSRSSDMLILLTQPALLWMQSASKQLDTSPAPSQLCLVIFRSLLFRLRILNEQALRISNTSEAPENQEALLLAMSSEMKVLAALMVSCLHVVKSLDASTSAIARSECWSSLTSWLSAIDMEALKVLMGHELDLYIRDPLSSFLPRMLKPDVLSLKPIGECLSQSLMERLSSSLPASKDTTRLHEGLLALSSGKMSLDLGLASILESQAARLQDSKVNQAKASGPVTRRSNLKNQPTGDQGSCGDTLRPEVLSDLGSVLAITRLLPISYLSADILHRLSSFSLLLGSLLLDHLATGGPASLWSLLEETIELSCSILEAIHRPPFLLAKSHRRKGSKETKDRSDDEMLIAQKLVSYASALVRFVVLRSPTPPLSSSMVKGSSCLYRILVRDELNKALNRNEGSASECLRSETVSRLVKEIETGDLSSQSAPLLLAGIVSELHQLDSDVCLDAKQMCAKAVKPLEHLVTQAIGSPLCPLPSSMGSISCVMETIGCCLSSSADKLEWETATGLLLTAKAILLSPYASPSQLLSALSFISASSHSLTSSPITPGSDVIWMLSFLLETLHHIPSTQPPIKPPTSLWQFVAMDLKEPRSIDVRMGLLKSFLHLLDLNRSSLEEILQKLSICYCETPSFLLPRLHCLLIALESTSGTSFLSVIASSADLLSSRLVAFVSSLSQQPLSDPATIACLCCALRCLESLCGREGTFHLSSQVVVQAAIAAAGLSPLLYPLSQSEHGLYHEEKDQGGLILPQDKDWKALNSVFFCSGSLLACLLRHRPQPLTRTISVIVHGARGMLQSIVQWVNHGECRESGEFVTSMRKSIGVLSRIYESASGLGLQQKGSTDKRTSAVLAKHCSFFLLDCIWILSSSKSPLPRFLLEAIKPGVFFLLSRLEKEPALLQHIHAVLGSGEGGARRTMLADMKEKWEKTKHSGKI